MISSSSNHSGVVASVFIALFGLFFLTKKVVRAKPPPLSGSKGGRGNAPVSKGKTTAYAVGLLDIAIPRDDRPGGSFRRVMINDACIIKAVQEVSKKLVVTLRDADTDIPAGVVRAYVSGLYQEIYDAASAARQPQLDFCILLPPAINGDGVDLLHPGSFCWASRGAAELAPDLETLISDDPRGDERCTRLNEERGNLGLSPVALLSLEAVAEKAHNPGYFYAEDVSANIPTFSSVACGGTFDRLHGGHKKLLTLAVSMCPGGRLTVGVTSDVLLKSKSNAHLITPLSERLRGVEDFVRTLNPQLQIRIEEITDPFGPPAVEEAFDAIVVSSETVAGAEKINQLRAQKGFRPLAVAVTRRMAVATLSSTYLRNVAEEQ